MRVDEAGFSDQLRTAERGSSAPASNPFDKPSFPSPLDLQRSLHPMPLPGFCARYRRRQGMRAVVEAPSRSGADHRGGRGTPGIYTRRRYWCPVLSPNRRAGLATDGPPSATAALHQGQSVRNPGQ